MLGYLKDSASVFKEAYDIQVTETARFYHDVVKFSVDQFDLNPDQTPEHLKLEVENAFKLRSELLSDLRRALLAREANHPPKYTKFSQQNMEADLKTIRATTSNIDQTLLDARHRIASTNSYLKDHDAGKKCAKITSQYKHNYFGAKVRNSCAIDLEFSLDFVVNIGSGKPKLENKRFTVNAGETYTTKVATKSLGGTSSEMTGNMCPVSRRNEVKADGTIKCAFSNSIDLVKLQMSEELQKIHSVLLKFAVVSRQQRPAQHGAIPFASKNVTRRR